MNNMYGITGIKTENIIINTSANDNHKVNEFLAAHDGNIIDIQYVGQFSGQVAVFITYVED